MVLVSARGESVNIGVAVPRRRIAETAFANWRWIRQHLARISGVCDSRFRNLALASRGLSKSTAKDFVTSDHCTCKPFLQLPFAGSLQLTCTNMGQRISACECQFPQQRSSHFRPFLHFSTFHLSLETPTEMPKRMVAKPTSRKKDFTRRHKPQTRFARRTRHSESPSEPR